MRLTDSGTGETPPIGRSQSARRSGQSADSQTDRADASRPLGPGSVIWYSAGDQRLGLFAIRALMFQVAHPMVGAGVGEHSVYKTDPYGRLIRTTKSVNKQVYGGARAAREGQRLIQMHTTIKGVDSQGRRYHALNPDAYMWVHATMYETWRLFLSRGGPGLTDAQDQQLFDEWYRMGLLIGCRPSALPKTRAEFWAMWSHMEVQLENNEVVQDLFYSAPRKPKYFPIPQSWLNALAGRVLRRHRRLIAATISPDLRGRVGLPAPTGRDQRKVEGMLRRSRALNRLPDRVRLAPLSRKSIERTLAEGGVTPEPVAYP